LIDPAELDFVATSIVYSGVANETAFSLRGRSYPATRAL
jgi:hypothetical protein